MRSRALLGCFLTAMGCGGPPPPSGRAAPIATAASAHVGAPNPATSDVTAQAPAPMLAVPIASDESEESDAARAFLHAAFSWNVNATWAKPGVVIVSTVAADAPAQLYALDPRTKVIKTLSASTPLPDKSLAVTGTSARRIVFEQLVGEPAGDADGGVLGFEEIMGWARSPDGKTVAVLLRTSRAVDSVPRPAAGTTARGPFDMWSSGRTAWTVEAWLATRGSVKRVVRVPYALAPLADPPPPPGRGAQDWKPTRFVDLAPTWNEATGKLEFHDEPRCKSAPKPKSGDAIEAAFAALDERAKAAICKNAGAIYTWKQGAFVR